jgi:hypothetical protein
VSPIFDFAESPLAFEKAQHQSRYDHKVWVVWKRADGTWRTGVATAENLGVAVAEGQPVFSGGKAILASVRCREFTNYQKPLAEVWLKNKQNGYC